MKKKEYKIRYWGIRMDDLVSIITPVYNAEKYIEDTIKSVLNQSYMNWELILINDCSSDCSMNIIKKYNDRDSRIRVIELNKNSGPAVARNTGIECAHGRFIAFLDSDDIWMPNKLEVQLNFMKKNNIYFSFTEYLKINENGENRGIVKVPKNLTYTELLKSNIIGCLTVVYDTHGIGKVYMPDIRKRQDYGLWLKILREHTNAYGIQKCLAKYRVRKNSVSSNKIKAASYQWQVYRKIEQLNLFKSIYYFINYTYYGLKKSKI